MVHLLVVSNVIPRKNIGALLRILVNLRRRGLTSWRLSIAGRLDTDVEHVASLRHAAAACHAEAERVTWLGVLDAPSLRSLYKAADVLILPSLFENYCMAAQVRLMAPDGARWRPMAPDGAWHRWHCICGP